MGARARLRSQGGERRQEPPTIHRRHWQPPYSASISEPAWLMEKLEDWKRGLNETKSDLNREEWKFLRLSVELCDRAGVGVIGHVINRDFLDGIAKRKMREHLERRFCRGIVLDLNGDVKGSIADENVFEIQQGVCICLLMTSPANERYSYCSLVGTRARKYERLLDRTRLPPPFGRLLPPHLLPLGAPLPRQRGSSCHRVRQVAAGE